MTASKSLGLRSGELVKIQSKEEILATLDADGALDALPFMPEMLQYCGRQFRVHKRADKTCDTIDNLGSRRMQDTVHLDGLRCDGAAHGGCEAGCLLFWKEAWLQRGGAQAEGARFAAANEPTQAHRARGASESDLQRACAQINTPGTQTIYRCQATRLKEASEPLAWWDVRQYVRDLWSGNATLGQMARGFVMAGFRRLIEIGIGYKILVTAFDKWQALRGGTPFPWREGSAEVTPTGRLDLRPGEWVRVKSHDEILATLDKNNKNRGLWYDPEMVKHSGKTYRVYKQVHRIIHEKHGHMIEFKSPAVILENVYCQGELTKYRLFCPRAIHTYWREIWLERATAPSRAALQRI